MANAQPKPKARRSRKSGLKKAALIRKNNEIIQNVWTHLNLEQLKKIMAILLIGMFVSCSVRYVYVDPKDSVVKRQRVVYDNYIAPSPFYDPFFRPYFWGPRPIIVVPRNQPQRPGFGPLPPTPKPRR